MSQELIYTSAPAGLKPGSRGFTTVVSTSGLSPQLAEQLESLSGYRHVFPPQDPQAALNPVVFSHVKIHLGGRRWSVLSRVCDAGLDYTQRTNKFAHHLVLDSSELVEGGPAWLMAQPGVMESTWDGTPRLLPVGRTLPQGSLPVGPCLAWQQLSADPAWAKVLAETATSHKPVVIIFRPGQNLLPLLAEALSIVPVSERWNVTFSTYFTKLPPGIDCQWRCLVAGSSEAQRIVRTPSTLILDLTSPLGLAPSISSPPTRSVPIRPTPTPDLRELELALSLEQAATTPTPTPATSVPVPPVTLAPPPRASALPDSPLPNSLLTSSVHSYRSSNLGYLVTVALVLMFFLQLGSMYYFNRKYDQLSNRLDQLAIPKPSPSPSVTRPFSLPPHTSPIEPPPISTPSVSNVPPDPPSSSQDKVDDSIKQPQVEVPAPHQNDSPKDQDESPNKNEHVEQSTNLANKMLYIVEQHDKKKHITISDQEIDVTLLTPDYWNIKLTHVSNGEWDITGLGDGTNKIRCCKNISDDARPVVFTYEGQPPPEGVFAQPARKLSDTALRFCALKTPRSNDLIYFVNPLRERAKFTFENMANRIWGGEGPEKISLPNVTIYPLTEASLRLETNLAAHLMAIQNETVKYRGTTNDQPHMEVHNCTWIDVSVKAEIEKLGIKIKHTESFNSKKLATWDIDEPGLVNAASLQKLYSKVKQVDQQITHYNQQLKPGESQKNSGDKPILLPIFYNELETKLKMFKGPYKVYLKLNNGSEILILDIGSKA